MEILSALILLYIYIKDILWDDGMMISKERKLEAFFEPELGSNTW